MSSVKGSPATSALNVLQGTLYDSRVDMYSLGCILYFLLYQKYPCERSENCCFTWDIADLIESNQITFDEIHLEETNPFYPVVSMIKKLLYYKENKMYWNNLGEEEFIKHCIEVASKHDYTTK